MAERHRLRCPSLRLVSSRDRSPTLLTFGGSVAYVAQPPLGRVRSGDGGSVFAEPPLTVRSHHAAILPRTKRGLLRAMFVLSLSATHGPPTPAVIITPHELFASAISVLSQGSSATRRLRRPLLRSPWSLRVDTRVRPPSRSVVP
jgi:hypothetical protein